MKHGLEWLLSVAGLLGWLELSLWVQPVCWAVWRYTLVNWEILITLLALKLLLSSKRNYKGLGGYMHKCENLSDWEHKPLFHPSMKDTQDEWSVFMQTDEWL